MANAGPTPTSSFLLKLARNEVLQFVVMGGILLGLVGIIFAISQVLSQELSKSNMIIFQGLHLLMAAATAWILARLLKRLIAYRFELKAAQYKELNPHTPAEVHVPRYIMTMFNWVVMLIFAGYVATTMFGEEAWNLLTAGGIVGAGIAFSLQGLVQDLISGLIIDMERRVKIGDWIRTGEDVFGEVIRMTWRYIEIRTEENTLKLIPNRDFTSITYENLSHFNGVIAHKISLPLDHNVPFNRIERVLMDALLGIPEVVETGIHQVFVSVVNEGGLTVDVRFGIKGFHNLPSARHKVYGIISRKIWESGIGLSESFGAYTIAQPSGPFKYLEDPKALDALKDVKLFNILTADERKALAQKAVKHIYDKNDTILHVGDESDSLFVIAEGAVDVIVPIQAGDTVVDEVVATLGAGNFVGDRALLLGEKRSATVKAVTQVVCFEVAKKAIQPILKARPELIDGFSETILERQLDTNFHINDVNSKVPKELNLKDELMKAMQKFFSL